MINLKSSIKVGLLYVDNFVSAEERCGKSNLNRKPPPPLCLAAIAVHLQHQACQVVPQKLITNSTKVSER